MLFNLETDYAIRIVDCLATQHSLMDATSISEITGVTRRFTLKILHKLVMGGFVDSKKGAKGGYQLAKPADDISLLDVIETVNGKIIFSRCQCAESRCSHPQSTCKFKGVFEQAGTTVSKLFKKVNFGG